MKRLLMVSFFMAFPACGLAQRHSHSATQHIGVAHFPVSCDPRIAGGFDRSVTLLHSFEFAEAIKGFQQVLATDSTCAIAYWGIALSKWGNPMAAGNRGESQLVSGLESVTAARSRMSHATDRERAYIDAVAKLYDAFDHVNQGERVLAYSRAMAELASKQPADTEATIFYAISLVAAAAPSDKSYSNQLKAGSILEALWKKEPSHPGLAHYIIHAYDYPALASRAAAAANAYATIAPSAAHALHMPSHIFTRTGLWKKSIETNTRSMQMAERAGSIAEALHAADYAEYAYLQLGDFRNAKRIRDHLATLAAKFDVNALTGAAPGSAGVFALAAIPARYALEREDWREAGQLVPTATAFPWTEAMTYFARAIGAAHTSDFTTAGSSIDSLRAIHDRLIAKDEAYWAEQVAIQALGAQAWLELARGQADSAESLMRETVLREDATEKNAVTPGPLAPARELLGDMLMKLGRAVEARTEYRRALAQEPNRRRSILGLERASGSIRR